MGINVARIGQSLDKALENLGAVTLKIPVETVDPVYGDATVSSWNTYELPALITFHPTREVLDDFGFTDSANTIVFISGKALTKAGINGADLSLRVKLEIRGQEMEVDYLRPLGVVVDSVLLYVFGGTVPEPYKGF